MPFHTVDSTRWFITLRSFMKQCFEIGHHYISRYFFLFFLAQQKYSRRFIILILNHCTHMNWLKYVFSTLMDLERGNAIAGYAGLTEPSDFNKNILICVPKINVGLTGLKRHEGWIINYIIFIFGWTNHLNIFNALNWKKWSCALTR